MIYHHHDHYHLQIQQYSLSSKYFVTAGGSYKVLTINKTELAKRIITHWSFLKADYNSFLTVYFFMDK